MTYLPTIQLKDGSEAVLVEDLMTDDRPILAPQDNPDWMAGYRAALNDYPPASPSPEPLSYEDRVEAMAAALHEDCRLEWQAIAVADPGRAVTQHGPDAHYGKAHDLVRRLPGLIGGNSVWSGHVKGCARYYRPDDATAPCECDSIRAERAALASPSPEPLDELRASHCYGLRNIGAALSDGPVSLPLDETRLDKPRVMTTPTTAAGRALLDRRESIELWHPVDGRRDDTLAAILAIEAEASAAALADAAAKVRELRAHEEELAGRSDVPASVREDAESRIRAYRTVLRYLEPSKEDTP